MDFQDVLEEFMGKASTHFSNVQPLIPTYIHLILSAVIPIAFGARASLSRPSSAAKPEKKTKKYEDTDEDEDEDKIQKMEGLSNKDAIILPLTAAIVLTGLYFLIMTYGADTINLILGQYFAIVSVYSVTALINDALNTVVSFVFPRYYGDNGSLWEVNGRERKIVVEGPPATTRFRWAKLDMWALREILKQKYTVDAFIQGFVDFEAKLTIINVFSALLGLASVVYANTVSRPWFLTNFQGFALSYSALRLMSPTSFGTGSFILSALFFYDIWAVFFTPLMVTVAKNLDQPIKMVIPRPDEPSETPGEPPVKSFSMLGLGDIVLPGIMIALALRFDLYMFYLKKQKVTQKQITDTSGQKRTEEVVEKSPYVPVTGLSGEKIWAANLPDSIVPAKLRSTFPKPYFGAAMMGYIVGMLTTLAFMSVFSHAQPALLYLVPGVLVSIWGTALLRGEIKEMWSFSEDVVGEQLEEIEGKASEASAKEDNQAEQTRKGLFERLWQEIWSGSESRNAKTTKDEEGKAETSTKSEKGADSSKKDDEDDDFILSFSISRYNSRAKRSNKSDKVSSTAAKEGKQQSSPSRSDTSEDAVMVSNADVDEVDEAVPRYRTRSTRSPSKI